MRKAWARAGKSRYPVRAQVVQMERVSMRPWPEEVWLKWALAGRSAKCK